MSKLTNQLGLTCALLFLLFQLAPAAYGWSAPPSTRPAGMAPAAPNVAQWYDGMSTASSITNCASIIQGMPYQEDGIRTYVGFNADPAVPNPAINQVYYVHVVLWSMGNSCAGQRAYIDISLPENTSLANDASHLIYCFYDGNPFTSDCPQTLHNSSYNQGWYEVPAPASSSYTWPMLQGHNFEFQIPVKSSTKLSNSLFQAKVWVLDGNISPWLNPQVGVYVFSNQITILYDTPSTTGITDVHALSTATVYTYGTGGTSYFDIGTDTNYSLYHDSGPLSSGQVGWIVTEDWTSSPGGPSVLQPDTLYHWRVRYVTGGQTYYGADQTFHTLRAGTATVGNGQASSCTQAALASQLALGTTKQVDFDCGTLPMTITLSSPLAISSDVTIDGGNKVTLDAVGTSSHIQFQASKHLTLTQISLVNGFGGNCGGSITVPGGAWLTLDEARFLNNKLHSTVWNISGAGAVCVLANGKADVNNSLFTKNDGYMGGGIANYGTTTITHTVFTANTASTGGAIYNEFAPLRITESTISGNTAIWNSGGGLAISRGTAIVQMSTVSGNVSKGSGGGVSSSGFLYLTNSTVSGNSAATNGGGLEIQEDFIATTATTLLNSTLANNTAGGQGGNIYRGAVASTKVKLKNTLVASGSPNNCDSGVTSQGNNLESANTCGLTAAGDKKSTDPKLGPLQNNGGTTNTRALLSGSPAIDAGTNVGCPATDQRGIARPQGSACDIGAYEVHVPAATTTTITSVQPEPSVIGQAVTVHFSVASGAGGTPTGNVTVSDSASAATCTATVAAGSCSMTFSAKGTRTLKATYSGDANFHGSASAPVSHMVNAPAGNRLYLPMLVR